MALSRLREVVPRVVDHVVRSDGARGRDLADVQHLWRLQQAQAGIKASRTEKRELMMFGVFSRNGFPPLREGQGGNGKRRYWIRPPPAEDNVQRKTEECDGRE
jgi:hypothetical protein